MFVFDVAKDPESGEPIKYVTHETVEIALRLTRADLHVAMAVSTDGEEILLHVDIRAPGVGSSWGFT